ncbi:hypothetical protein Lal_00004193 [Lupinus albus]|nr:hypothetical protein Lal_00004193 [Lupinus albus]
MSIQQESQKTQTCYILKVNIHCGDCEKKVKKLMHKIDGVYSVSIDKEQGKVIVAVDVDMDPERLIKTLKRSGKNAEMWNGDKGIMGYNQNYLQVDNGVGVNYNNSHNQNQNGEQIAHKSGHFNLPDMIFDEKKNFDERGGHGRAYLMHNNNSMINNIMPHMENAHGARRPPDISNGQPSTFNGPNGQPSTVNGPNGQPTTLNGPRGQVGMSNGPNAQYGTFNGPNGQPSTFNGPNGQPSTLNGPRGQVGMFNSQPDMFNGHNGQPSMFNGPYAPGSTFNGSYAPPSALNGPNGPTSMLNRPNAPPGSFNGPNAPFGTFNAPTSLFNEGPIMNNHKAYGGKGVDVSDIAMQMMDKCTCKGRNYEKGMEGNVDHATKNKDIDVNKKKKKSACAFLGRYLGFDKKGGPAGTNNNAKEWEKARNHLDLFQFDILRHNAKMAKRGTNDTNGIVGHMGQQVHQIGPIGPPMHQNGPMGHMAPKMHQNGSMIPPMQQNGPMGPQMHQNDPMGHMAPLMKQNGPMGSQMHQNGPMGHQNGSMIPPMQQNGPMGSQMHQNGPMGQMGNVQAMDRGGQGMQPPSYNNHKQQQDMAMNPMMIDQQQQQQPNMNKYQPPMLPPNHSHPIVDPFTYVFSDDNIESSCTIM